MAEVTVPPDSGACVPQRIGDWLRSCGFEPGAGPASSSSPEGTGGAADAILRDFLSPLGEDRQIPPCRPLPDGLIGIRSLGRDDRDIGRQLFESAYFSQLRHPVSADRIWRGLRGEFIACLREMNALPYYIIGDSHTGHYTRRARIGTEWLAPLPMLCGGAAASDLSDLFDEDGYGHRILRWAHSAADRGGDGDVPIFLKFGGIDSEVRWLYRRIKRAAHQFSFNEYADFAKGAVARYGRFLDALARIVDPARLRVCSVFPPALADDRKIESYSLLLGSDPHRDEVLNRLEIPDIRVRTQLRALYNLELEAFCVRHKLIFVDDFKPLVDPRTGSLSRRYFNGHDGGNWHVNYDTTARPILRIIAKYIRQGAPNRPTPGSREAL